MLAINQLLNPLGEEKYKITTSQKSLNTLLKNVLVKNIDELLELRVIAVKNKLHIRGIIKEPDYMAKWKMGNIHFDISLQKEEIIVDVVNLKIIRFRIYNPNKRIDLLRIINKFSHKIQKSILEGFTGKESPFNEIKPYKMLSFDLKFILSQVPAEMNLLGKITILNVGFESKKIVWYIESNLMVKSVLEYWGPEYVDVEKIDISQDAIKLLTDFSFEFRK